MLEKLREAITGADLVLVGIGTEFAQTFEKMQTDAFYKPLLEQADHRQDAQEISQYLQCHFLKKHGQERILQAYDKLEQMLGGKNYFILSLNTDDLIYRTALAADRIVTPCGGYRALQCPDGCSQDVHLVTDESVWEAVLQQIDTCAGDLAGVKLPVCENCGKTLMFNQIATPGYQEEGYLPQWQRYTMWLQGTLNKKLVILELGVGMQFPQIIRFPFEKVGFYNQKSRFYRIHSKLYQLTEELKERGTAIQKNPVDFLLGEDI